MLGAVASVRTRLKSDVIVDMSVAILSLCFPVLYVSCNNVCWLPFVITSVDVKFGFVFVRSNSEKASNKRKNKKRKLEETEGKTFQSSQTNSGTELTETGSEGIRKRKKKQKNWKVIKLFWWIILDKFVYELFETLSWIVQATEKNSSMKTADISRRNRRLQRVVFLQVSRSPALEVVTCFVDHIKLKWAGTNTPVQLKMIFFDKPKAQLPNTSIYNF